MKTVQLTMNWRVTQQIHFCRISAMFIFSYNLNKWFEMSIALATVDLIIRFSCWYSVNRCAYLHLNGKVFAVDQKLLLSNVVILHKYAVMFWMTYKSDSQFTFNWKKFPSDITSALVHQNLLQRTTIYQSKLKKKTFFSWSKI